MKHDMNTILFWVLMGMGVIAVFALLSMIVMIVVSAFTTVSPFLIIVPIMMVIIIHKQIKGWFLGFYYRDSSYFPKGPFLQ